MKSEIALFDRRICQVGKLSKAIPDGGWFGYIRQTLGLSLAQVGDRLNISRQSVAALEHREMEGTITIQSLRKAAEALELEFVYGLVPKGGSLVKLIEHQAYLKAKELVMQTMQTMSLEGQAISQEDINEMIRQRQQELIQTMPKWLWDR